MLAKINEPLEHPMRIFYYKLQRLMELVTHIPYFRKKINDCGLKDCIFIGINDLPITVNYHEFTCGQKVVRCVSMA